MSRRYASTFPTHRAKERWRRNRLRWARRLAQRTGRTVADIYREQDA